jgi:hypothetical protein
MKFIDRKPLPRRVFLKGAGGVVLALPFLEASVSKAQNVPVPKRFVVWFTPCGAGAGSYPRSLDLSGSPYEPLQPYADQLIVTRGIAMKSVAGQSTPPHPTGFGHMLTGNRCTVRGDDILGAQNESIDQFIAARMGPTRVASSLHGVVNERNMSWVRAPSGAVSSLRAEQDPGTAFQRLFGGVSAAPDPSTADPAEERRHLRRQAMVDAVRGSYQALACQLGGEDKKRVEAHLDFVRDMERGMGGGSASVTSYCTVPGVPGRFDVRSIPSGRDIGRAHMDVLVHALECDITRVGTLQWYSHTAVHGSPYGWATGLKSHHVSSHEGGTAGHDRAYATELARFLGLLKEARAEDGSSLLHHTVVLCISELGISGTVHHLADLPILIAGSGGGRLKTGQYIDLLGSNRSGFTRAPDWKAQQAPSEYFRPFDVSHNDLFIELANAVAPEGAEPVKTFGRADVCTGGVPQLRA